MFNFNFIRKIKKFFFPFYKSSDLKFVFKKLQQDVPSQSKAAMFVGGCVRKHLSNEEVEGFVLIISTMADRLYPYIRQLLCSRESEIVNRQRWEIFNNKMTVLIKNRMNIKKVHISKIIKS